MDGNQDTCRSKRNINPCSGGNLDCQNRHAREYNHGAHNYLEHHGCVGNATCDSAITDLQIGAGVLDFYQVIVSTGELFIGEPWVLFGVGMAIAAPPSAPAALAGALGMDAAIAAAFEPFETGPSLGLSGNDWLG